MILMDQPMLKEVADRVVQLELGNQTALSRSL